MLHSIIQNNSKGIQKRKKKNRANYHFQSAISIARRTRPPPSSSSIPRIESTSATFRGTNVESGRSPRWKEQLTVPSNYHNHRCCFIHKATSHKISLTPHQTYPSSLLIQKRIPRLNGKTEPGHLEKKRDSIGGVVFVLFVETFRSQASPPLRSTIITILVGAKNGRFKGLTRVNPSSCTRANGKQSRSRSKVTPISSGGPE